MSDLQAAALAGRFAQFWEAYPRKVGKVAVWKAWRRISPDQALLERMLTTLAWQKKSQQWQRGYIPLPMTWINQGRWEDEPFEPQSSMAVSSRPMSRARIASEETDEAVRKVLERQRQRLLPPQP